METLILYMVIPGRINFLQLGRYGASCEQRFRENFSKDFDWLEFNSSLSGSILTGDRKAIAIDPSYISKSGKDTLWIGYFWSGTAGQAKRGLEILGVGLVDIDNNDCISLEAVQTPDIPFSMASCKSMIHNAYLLDRFICVSGIRPNRRLNDKLVKELIEFAAITA